MKLIDKDAVLAEIERRIKTNKECMLGLRNLDYYQGKVDALNDTISSLDTLEAKEMELDMKTFGEEMTNVFNLPSDETTNTEEEPLNWEYAIAKHFFELGLNASNPLTWEDILIIHRCIKDAMNFKLYKMMKGVEGQKEVYEEVLKRFKAQKREEV